MPTGKEKVKEQEKVQDKLSVETLTFGEDEMPKKPGALRHGWYYVKRLFSRDQVDPNNPCQLYHDARLARNGPGKEPEKPTVEFPGFVDAIMGTLLYWCTLTTVKTKGYERFRNYREQQKQYSVRKKDYDRKVKRFRRAVARIKYRREEISKIQKKGNFTLSLDKIRLNKEPVRYGTEPQLRWIDLTQEQRDVLNQADRAAENANKKQTEPTAEKKAVKDGAKVEEKKEPVMTEKKIEEKKDLLSDKDKKEVMIEMEDLGEKKRKEQAEYKNQLAQVEKKLLEFKEGSVKDIAPENNTLTDIQRNALSARKELLEAVIKGGDGLQKLSQDKDRRNALIRHVVGEKIICSLMEAEEKKGKENLKEFKTNRFWSKKGANAFYGHMERCGSRQLNTMGDMSVEQLTSILCNEDSLKQISDVVGQDMEKSREKAGKSKLDPKVYASLFGVDKKQSKENVQKNEMIKK